MTYATLLVHLELGRSNAGLLNVSAELAERFGASVIGIAGRQPMQMIYGDGYVAGDMYQQDCDEIVKEVKAAEHEFRAALEGCVRNIEWRSAQRYAYLADCIANEARSADLIVSGVASGGLFDESRVADTGALLMQAGRPVLLVPAGAETLKLDRILVAWKDTRETRRAVSDALPLLKRANHVDVVEIAAEDDLQAAQGHVADLVAWLKRHKIEARGSTLLSTGDDAAALYAHTQDQGADVIVAGAYGHSRLKEWAFGGVTRDLLLSSNRCSLLSH